MMQRVCNQVFRIAPRMTSSLATSNTSSYCTDSGNRFGGNRYSDNNFGDRNNGPDVREYKTWHRILIANQGQREKAMRQIRKGDKIYVDGAIKQSKLADGSFASYILAERVLRLNRNRGMGAAGQLNEQMADIEAEDVEQDEEQASRLTSNQ